ncbi:MAG: HAMP domain-containing histidine kinase, partial [Phycisphaeraceae bacterium]|nr:HAMP domain-containing histidine kinase [Phycisphaeraceae bacterium]
ALDKLADLGSDEHRLARIGAGALRNIVHRVSDEQDDAALALLDRVKSRALADAGLASEHAGRIRARLVTVLALALLAAALTAALALLLLRRWVVRPVAQLRLAAARIGAGDYAHRLPASGQDEIALLSAEVNRMAANIEQLLEERVERERLAATREMLRRIVHNLRNPLAGIRGLAELTRSELSENPDSGELAENQDRIMNAVDRFESWLADILRSTSPLTIIPQPQPVVCWLDRVVETLRPAGDLHALRIEIDHAHAPESAMFDAGHLEHALVAVLTNAIQASPRNSTIAVRATSENGDGAWRIEVADQGEGVPEPLQDRIFRAHFTTKRDGTGIGLAVARQVVRAHGGSIRVENISAAGAAAPAGARFTLRLPLEPPGDTQADDRDSDD